MKSIVIDAKNQSLGRIVSQVALVLQGKSSPDYDPAKKSVPSVKLVNVSQIKFTGNKQKTTIYRWHTGYIGHLRTRTLEELWKTKPDFVVRHAVKGMLPKNHLRDRRLRNLKIEL